MAFPSSIAIVFIGVAAYVVTAGPVQGISSTVQRDEYESPVLADLLLAKYLEDRSANGRTKRNDDPDAYEPINIQRRRLLDLENRLSQHSDSDKILEERQKISVNGWHEIHNSPLHAETSIDTSNHYPYVENANTGQLYIPQLVNHDVLDNAKEHDGKLAKSRDDNLDRVNSRYVARNLDQIGGGHLVRNLDQIGGGHLVRNPDNEYRVRNLDQIGGGHLVRNPEQRGGYFVSNLGYIDNVHIPANLDHIGGEHLVEHPDQIGGSGHPDEIDDEDVGRKRASNVEARRLDAGVASRRLDAGVASRKLDAAVASRKLDAAVAARKLDAAVAARKLDAAVAARKLDAAVAARKLDAAVASRQLDAAIALRQLQQAAVDSRRLQALAQSLNRLRTDAD